MKPFVALIFEINCYETEPLVKIQWGKSFEWGRKPARDPQATIWLHVACEEKWKEQIPIDLEQSCIQLCGPVSWKTAEETIRGLKASFEALNLEHFELTCSDD